MIYSGFRPRQIAILLIVIAAILLIVIIAVLLIVIIAIL